jgi:ribosomal protein S21
MKSTKVSKAYFKPYYVIVKNNRVDIALKQLSKTLEANDFFDKLRERQYYEKPSVRKRRQKQLSRYK